MITKEKLRIFKKYNSDIDAWARVANRKELKVISDNDWYQIDEFIQNLGLISKNSVSESFKLSVFEKLEQACDNIETMEKLKNMAN